MYSVEHSRRVVEQSLLRLKWLAAAANFELAMRRHARALKAYNPNQPRVPRGNPDGGEWTDAGGGSSGTSTGTSRTRVSGPGAGRTTRVGQNFPGATHGQQVRLEQTIARTETALAKIRQQDPSWRPKTQSWQAPTGFEGAIQHAQARMIEAEAHLGRLRHRVGGNFGPPLQSAPRAELGTTPSQVFDGPSWIGAYRATHSMPDLFGKPTWDKDRDTVATAEVGGSLVFGVNSSAPAYTGTDRRDADAWRRNLVTKYPNVMQTENIGGAPNNSLYHAETTVLLRAAKENDGTLADRNIEVHVDREMCSSCQDVLPYLGLELGNPVVTFVDPKGRKRTMWNGSWLDGKGK
jgi:hypothetical protein